jgi:hypothetical protein
MGKEQSQDQDREGPEGQDDPVPQTVGAGDAPLGKQDEAYGRETHPFQSAAVQEMDQQRERGSDQSVEVDRMEKKD